MPVDPITFATLATVTYQCKEGLSKRDRALSQCAHISFVANASISFNDINIGFRYTLFSILYV